MYPRVIIHRDKYHHNVEKIATLCAQHGITISVVTKVFCAEQPLIDVLNVCDVSYVADSRIANLQKMHTHLPRMLLRIPSMHEAETVVKVADISLNSEIETIRRLNDAAAKERVRHKIVLMMDVGDLREGLFFKDDVENTVQAILSLSHIELYGLGTNLTCYGGVIPDQESLGRLGDMVVMLKQKYQLELKMVSGGNSSHLYLLQEGQHPPFINHLRIGEAIVLGRETAYGKPMPDLYQDVFVLESDLIELKKKPSIPMGKIGMNAFGKTPQFEDYGLMDRGILAIGKQDVDYHELIPEDPTIRLIGSSSDHLIIDLTHAKASYKVGDILRFRLTYGSVLSLMTSRYVRKVYV
ncbi:MAG: alanine/ornithine racemase family PLP-dependent enzyme [Acholeplasmatales bacterium]|nr:MAG: alanine/ornithine racemase family PLP-dependent enzyme [Acholeplasmatales bacterium]